MTRDLPVLGVALSLDMLDLHRDWVLESQRDVELQSFCWPNTDVADYPAMIARALRLLDGHSGRLGLHGPFMSFKIDCADPAITEVIRQRMLRTLEICAALGADQMVIHSPYGMWNEAECATSPAAEYGHIERVRYVLAPVIAETEALGVDLVIENVEDIDPRARVRLAEALKSTRLRVSLDTGHAQMMHSRCGAPPVDAFVQAAGARLGHVHLQDIDGFADRHWHPGEGVVPWHSVFAALHRLPRMPRLILEVDDERGVRRGAEYLAALGLAR